MEIPEAATLPWIMAAGEEVSLTGSYPKRKKESQMLHRWDNSKVSNVCFFLPCKAKGASSVLYNRK